MVRRTVTQKDIAELCGVSTALVSYVLNGKAKQGRVSDAMAARIRETAAQLNYRVNTAARTLKGKPQMTIGCILADIANPFFSVLARKIEDECYRRGYTVIFGSSDESPEKLERLVDVMLSRQVDGLLVSPPEGSSATLRQIHRMGVPLVLLDRRGRGDSGLPYVGIDNYTASYRVTERLIESGYTRIGMVGHDSELMHFAERMRGYRAALEEHGIAAADSWIVRVRHAAYEEEVPGEIDRLLDREGVRALYFGSNNLALTGLRHLFRRGSRVPRDVEVAAFDDHDIYDFFDHPITHVRQPLEEISKRSVALLLDEIASPREGSGPELLLEARVHRGSDPPGNQLT